VLAEEAVNTGLANLAVPGDELDAAVRDLAAALLAAPRDAVIETKALLRGALDRTYEEQRVAERAAQGRRLRDLAGPGDWHPRRPSPPRRPPRRAPPGAGRPRGVQGCEARQVRLRK